jgi:hypothetical protein
MISKKRRNLLFLQAAILTFFIFFLAIVLNVYLDQFRISYLEEELVELDTDFSSLVTFNYFSNTFSLSDCELFKEQIFFNQKNLKEFGEDLSNFGQLFSFNFKNVSSLKQRTYFQKEIYLYHQVLNYNMLCSEKIFPVVYFFNEYSTSLDKQGTILEEFYLNHKNKTIIFSFPFYFDKEPLLESYKLKYNVTYPVFIILPEKTSLNLEKDGNGLISINTLTLEYKYFQKELERVTREQSELNKSYENYNDVMEGES